MKDLESKLKALPLRAPSREFDDRVLAQKPERPVEPRRAPWRVPVWATAAVALAMAVAGFAAGMSWRGERPIAAGPVSRPTPIIVHVIYNSPSSGNPFDFTLASDIFPAGKMEPRTHEEKGA